MGGTALLIYGTPSPERLTARPVPRTLMDRLLGRTRTKGPKVVNLGRAELIELDASELQPLVARYQAYVARELTAPTEATTQVREYLALDRIPSLYLRGERDPGQEPEWYAQLGFSGCGGMAEVSALVAGHWAARWIEKELPEIEREIFTPFGFAPRPDQTFGWPDLFLPVAQLGYLRYVPPDEREPDGLVFEVDHAVIEGDDEAEGRLADASRRHAGTLADGHCRCQLCAPGFEPLT